MLSLRDVTLCCLDTARQRLALRALQRSCESIRFARTLLLTDALPPGIDPPPDVEIVYIAPVDSRDAYSRFVLKGLLPYVATSHVLLVQWDGYVWNPDAWDDAFMACDYIGATWFWHNDGMRVGNGGFSLRSRRLLEALQDSRITLQGGEDETIGRSFRPLLEREHGIRFADEAMADRFAFEAAYPIGRPFGFHGLFNFCRVVPQEELAALAPSFDDAIARSPQCAQLLRNCIAMGQWSAAAALAQRILAADPRKEEASRLLAQATTNAARAPAAARNDPCPCGSGKRYKHCHGVVDRASSGSPLVSGSLTPDALVAQGLAAHQRGDLGRAEDAYRGALVAAPDHPYALHYMGVLHYQCDRFADALPMLQQAADRVPHEPEFHNNLGLALAAMDRVDDAIDAYRRTLSLKPDHAIGWNNLGLALQAIDDLPAAIDAFRRSVSLAPPFAQAHWNLGLALLAHGEFAEGWREYEWRLQIPELGRDGRIHAGPRWNGADPAGKTILLTREQGLGDTLQFARFARQLAALGARVVVETQDALVRLLPTVPGVAAVYGPGDTLPPYDFHLPLLSVAGMLDIGAADMPNEVPYLTPDAAQVATVGPLLETFRRTLKVGISWAGRPEHPNDRRRSCPLSVLSPLFTLPQVTWFSLQKSDGEEQIAAVPAARGMIRLDERNDFDRKAALVSSLDLVISVDTANAHLAGALGRPVWILLPFAADWRWQQARTDSAWYPTARLFRQPRMGDWAAVVDDVQSALGALITEPR